MQYYISKNCISDCCALSRVLSRAIFKFFVLFLLSIFIFRRIDRYSTITYSKCHVYRERLQRDLRNLQSLINDFHVFIHLLGCFFFVFQLFSRWIFDRRFYLIILRTLLLYYSRFLCRFCGLTLCMRVIL